MDLKTQGKLMGKVIDFQHRLVRDVQFENGARVKTWKPAHIPGRGWVVGFRWLQNGVATWEGEEVGTAWEQRGPTVPCVMVAVHPQRSHVFVPISEITSQGVA